MTFPPIEPHVVDQREYKVPSNEVENLNHSRENRHKEHGDCKQGERTSISLHLDLSRSAKERSDVSNSQRYHRLTSGQSTSVGDLEPQLAPGQPRPDM